MTPEKMLKIPFAKRRGAVTEQRGGAQYLLVQVDPDTLLDTLTTAKIIGASRRKCHAQLHERAVPRPAGSWGAVITFKGHPWTYIVGDDLKPELAKQWAAAFNWRTAWFFVTGHPYIRYAQLYDGPRELFNFH